MMRIGVAGCTGRMGRMLVEAIGQRTDVTLAAVSALSQDAEKAAHLLQNHESDVAIVDNPQALAATCDAVIDFTSPIHSLQLAEACAARNTIMVCGTTGFDDAQIAKLRECNATIIHAANFSIGVNLLVALTRQVAATLDKSYDIEVSETHHRYKKDAPSGTALALGEAAAKGRGVVLADVSNRGRDGIIGEREAGAIGFHALRGGDVIGDHTVMFAALGERIELTHKASDRRIYADGAIRAALWAKDKPHGYYTMQDVIA